MRAWCCKQCPTSSCKQLSRSVHNVQAPFVLKRFPSQISQSPADLTAFQVTTLLRINIEKNDFPNNCPVARGGIPSSCMSTAISALVLSPVLRNSDLCLVSGPECEGTEMGGTTLHSELFQSSSQNFSQMVWTVLCKMSRSSNRKTFVAKSWRWGDAI